MTCNNRSRIVQTLDDLHSWKVSVLAQTGLSFDLSTASGKLMRTIMAGLAEFERDLIRDRVKSGPGPAARYWAGNWVSARPTRKQRRCLRNTIKASHIV
jgi:resolvase-like protein